MSRASELRGGFAAAARALWALAPSLHPESGRGSRPSGACSCGRSLVGVVVACALFVGVAVPSVAVELEGTWHVLVHYKDAESSKPEQERWEDRLWVFERKGDRLQWTEYPIVVFDDQSGRFERLGTNRASRVLGYWDPNEAQRAEIAAGLEYNTRGSKQKTLRGSDLGGWSSGSGSGYQSARFLTYTETWSVGGLPDAPVFEREDMLGGAGAEEFAGRTVYETTSVAEGGDVLTGRFERDGTRSGTFRISRSGAAAIVKGSGRSQGERVYEAFFGEMAGQLYRGNLPEGAAEEELRRRIEAGELTEEDRAETRRRFEDFVEEQYRAQGNDPRAHRPQIQSLSRKLEKAYLDEGKSLEEIQELIRNGQLRP